MSERHEMHRVKTYETGATEWLCDECGCQIIVQAEPFKRIFLNSGDEMALHSAIEGGAVVKASTFVHQNITEPDQKKLH